MRGFQIVVIIEHGDLQIQHLLHCQSTGGQHLPIVRIIVNHQRNRHEKYHAAAQRNGQLARKSTHLFAVLGAKIFARAPIHREEKEERQSGGGVDSRPLAGPGEAHKQAAQAQRNQRLPQGLAEEAHLHIPDHEQIHHHDEKYDIAIDRGDARLRKVHGIQRQQIHGNAG